MATYRKGMAKKIEKWRIELMQKQTLAAAIDAADKALMLLGQIYEHDIQEKTATSQDALDAQRRQDEALAPKLAAARADGARTENEQCAKLIEHVLTGQLRIVGVGLAQTIRERMR